VAPVFDNPFRTAPGSEPPVIAGRDADISTAAYAVGMTAAGAPAQPVVFTGLRGMGKTTLLRYCAHDAAKAGGIVIAAEAAEAAEPLSATVHTAIERARDQNISRRLKAAFDGVLRTLPKLTYDLPHEGGGISISAGDPGVQEHARSVGEALTELNEAARGQGHFLALTIDEVQSADLPSLQALVRVVHESAGSQQPMLLFCAGLPNSRERLHTARTYTERYRYLRQDLLSPEDAAVALVEPMRALGVAIDAEALAMVVDETAGYPFFIQEYGSAIWLSHRGDRVTTDEVRRILPGVRRTLEADFYESAIANLTPREVAYVIGLAQLGRGMHPISDVSAILGVSSEGLSSTRNQLIKKDVIYSPAHGAIEFRIPLTEMYVDRHREALTRKAALATRRRRDALSLSTDAG
jgi:hypothetical protein